MEKINIPKRIIERVKEVETASDFGTSIIRESDLETEFDASFSRDGIKQKYKERYIAYRKLLRKSKTENGGGETDEEIKKLQTWIRALNNLDDYIESHKREGSVLRERQATVFEDIRDAFEKGKTKGYVKLPTGVGKTVLFSQIVEAMELKTLILVPTKILVGQTGEKLDQFTDLDYGEYSSMKKDLTGNVDIMTYQSFVSLVSNGKLNTDQYQLIIEDEVHRALGDETSNAISRLNAVKVGFTATPEFKKKKVSDQLPTLYREISVKEAAETGLISRFKCIVAKTDVDMSRVPIVNGDYKKEDIEKAVNIQTRNKAAVDFYKTAFADKSAVAYCSGLDHAKDVLAEFVKQGVSADVISGNTSDDYRKDILDRFNKGITKVLVNARVLIEGFDEPRASVCLNLHPTLSKVDAEQRAGRVLRLDKEDPEKWGVVVDFVDKNSARPAITFAEIVGAAEVEVIDDPRDGRESKGGVGGRKKLPQVDISGIEIVYDTEEVMQIASSNEQLRDANTFEQAPEGWRTTSSLKLELQSSYITIKLYAESFRLSNPKWFKRFKNQRLIAEHYSPELVKEIKKYFTGLNGKPPEGWRTGSSLIPELKSANETVKLYVERFRKSNPEWFQKFKISGPRAEYYSPELVDKIIVHFQQENKESPEGWRTASSLMSELKAKNKSIKQYTERFRKSNPEWFEKFKISGPSVEFFSPELVARVKGYFLDLNKQIPEGWKTASSLMLESKAKYVTIKLYAENFKLSNPEWFGEFKAGNKTVEHYSPELVSKIKERFGERKQKQEEGE